MWIRFVVKAMFLFVGDRGQQRMNFAGASSAVWIKGDVIGAVAVKSLSEPHVRIILIFLGE